MAKKKLAIKCSVCNMNQLHKTFYEEEEGGDGYIVFVCGICQTNNRISINELSLRAYVSWK